MHKHASLGFMVYNNQLCSWAPPMVIGHESQATMHPQTMSITGEGGNALPRA